MFNSKLALAPWASVNVPSTISNVKRERRLKGISHKRLALEVQKWSRCDISVQSSYYVSVDVAIPAFKIDVSHSNSDKT